MKQTAILIIVEPEDADKVIKDLKADERVHVQSQQTLDLDLGGVVIYQP